MITRPRVMPPLPAVFAASVGAIVAVRRGAPGYPPYRHSRCYPSLSGTRLVLPSPNGGNPHRRHGQGRPHWRGVCATRRRWQWRPNRMASALPSSLRGSAGPAMGVYARRWRIGWGAGAIISALEGTRSPEAQAAARHLSGRPSRPGRGAAVVWFWPGTAGAWLCPGCGARVSLQRQYVCASVPRRCVRSRGPPSAQGALLTRSPPNKRMQVTGNSVRSFLAPAISRT